MQRTTTILAALLASIAHSAGAVAVNGTAGHSADLLPPGQPIVPHASSTPAPPPKAEDEPRAPLPPLPFVPMPIRPPTTQAIPGATAIPWMTPPPGLDAPTWSKPHLPPPPKSAPKPSANATAADDDDDDDDDDETMVVLGAAGKKWALPAVAVAFAASALVLAVAAVVVSRRRIANRADDGAAPSWLWPRDAAAGQDGAYIDAESAFLVADTR